MNLRNIGRQCVGCFFRIVPTDLKPCVMCMNKSHYYPKRKALEHACGAIHLIKQKNREKPCPSTNTDVQDVDTNLK